MKNLLRKYEPYQIILNGKNRFFSTRKSRSLAVIEDDGKILKRKDKDSKMYRGLRSINWKSFPSLMTQGKARLSLDSRIPRCDRKDSARFG